MAELRIEVSGCGMDSGCIGTFDRYSQLVSRWYRGRVDVSYDPDSVRTEEPLIIVRKGDEEVHRWETVPTVSELKTYLTGQLGLPAMRSERPELAVAGFSSHRRVPPW